MARDLGPIDARRDFDGGQRRKTMRCLRDEQLQSQFRQAQVQTRRGGLMSRHTLVDPFLYHLEPFLCHFTLLNSASESQRRTSFLEHCYYLRKS